MTPARIVVADDNQDNRRLLVGILTGRGYLVIEAADGRQSLDAIDVSTPDLLLLDLRMPRTDGFFVLEALETRAAGFLPIIVISAATEREERIRALRLGAHEFVSKPIDAEELCVRVATLLELKTAREAMARHNQRLEYEVAIRTAKLRSANERLKAASRHKDEFLSVVSHELRTPLTSIAGAAANLADGVGGTLRPAQQDLLALVVQGANRLSGMVEDLLQVAELRAGRYALELNPTPFASLVDEALYRIGGHADAAGILLDAAVDVPEPVCIDARRIFSVLGKLLDNAIRFTPAGGRVAVRAWCLGDSVQCEVADTGVGISPEALPGLFDLFRQLDMSTTREASGLGLGLALARAHVESHGGTISATSELGRGSRFTFTLPRHPAGVATPRIAALISEAMV